MEKEELVKRLMAQVETLQKENEALPEVPDRLTKDLEPSHNQKVESYRVIMEDHNEGKKKKNAAGAPR